MDKPKTTRSWFIGIALGTLFALLLWPTTRGLIQRQFLSLLFTSSYDATLRNYLGIEGPASDGERAETRVQEVATRYPDDAFIQFADALRTRPNDTPEEKWQRLNTLVARFPDSPSLHANALRMMTQHGIRMAREEDYLFVGEPIPDHDSSPPAAGLFPAQQIAVFNQLCEAGERLDPDNAAFSFLQAIGLFASRRDAEALDALHRAAGKPRWEEYARDQVEGQWRLISEASGNASPMLKVAVGAGLLLPHYTQFRSVARVATWKASEAEKAGRLEEGLAIRRSLRQIGSLMRVQSPTLIGNLIGIAIIKTSLLRPGGAPYVKFQEETGSGQEVEPSVQAYENWLQKVGKNLPLNSPRAEVMAGLQTKEVITHPENPAFGGEAFVKLIGLQIGTALVLANALWILLLGGAATLKLTLHSLSHRPHLLGTILLSISLLALGVLLINGMRYGELSISLRILTDLLPGEEGSLSPNSRGSALPMLVSLGCAVPLILLLVLAGFSRVCRVPLSVGVSRGLRGCAPVLGCTLLLLYSGLIIAQARQEKSVMAGMDRTLQHEGRYLAELSGKEWPGPTR